MTEIGLWCHNVGHGNGPRWGFKIIDRHIVEDIDDCYFIVQRYYKSGKPGPRKRLDFETVYSLCPMHLTKKAMLRSWEYWRKEIARLDKEEWEESQRPCPMETKRRKPFLYIAKKSPGGVADDNAH